ncbi:MAG: 2-dehydropantoate 2-reductase [Deltaproteobacteria bacterium]|nr:2-dehydropantoate 2-reductase [Deltaproteobacteria bacterium]
MRVAIVGVGGVGGFFGGKMARYYAGDGAVEMVFIARGAHLRAIQEGGLRVTTPEEEFTARPDFATDDPAGCGIFDLALFCVKTYDLEQAVALVRENLGKESRVITLMNGVDNTARLRDALPGVRILNGCAYVSTRIVRPGHVQQTGGFAKLFFGAEQGDPAPFRPIEGLMRGAGIDATCREDIRQAVWEKYLFISPSATLTSALGKTFGEVLADNQARGLLEGLIAETGALAEKEGIRIPDTLVDTVLEKMASFPPGTRTSMQLDFERGGRAELETFTGYVVRAGKALGVAVPLHERIYDDLRKRLDSGP